MLAIIRLDDAPLEMPFNRLNGTYNGILPFVMLISIFYALKG